MITELKSQARDQDAPRSSAIQTPSPLDSMIGRGARKKDFMNALGIPVMKSSRATMSSLPVQRHCVEKTLPHSSDAAIGAHPRPFCIRLRQMTHYATASASEVAFTSGRSDRRGKHQ